MTHSATLLLLDALSVYRLTRLIVADSIMAPFRVWAAGLAPNGARTLTGEQIRTVARPKIAELLTCPWCISPWLAGAVVACQVLAAGVWLYVAAVLAFSAVAGILSERV